MSLFLLNYGDLESNGGQIPLCSMPIRTETCGIYSKEETVKKIECHYKQDIDFILEYFFEGYNENIKNTFVFPNAWICKEYCMYMFKHFEDEISSVNIKDTEQIDLDQHLSNLNQLIPYIESKDYVCYFSEIKRFEEKNRVVYSYIQKSEPNTFIPNESNKIVLVIDFYKKDGNSNVVFSLTDKNEEIVLESILNFVKI